MRASDFTTSLVVVDRSTSALDAVRLIADQDLIGLVIAEDGAHPSSVVSSVDVLRYLLPRYLLDDLALTNTVGDVGLDDLRQGLEGRTIGDLVDDSTVRTRPVLVVPADAGPIEIAARMVDRGTQVALVEDPSRSEPVFVTLPALLDAIVARWDAPGPSDAHAPSDAEDAS